MSVEQWALLISVVALIVEGPIVWWITSKYRKEDSMQSLTKEMRNSVRKVHERIDAMEDTHATKDYVNDKIDHVKEVNAMQYSTIMEHLAYIRSRVDEQSKNQSNK